MQAGKLQDVIARVRESKEPQLDLSHRGLTEVPAGIGSLSHLTSLILSHNNLIRLPSEIGALGNLRELDLCGNKLVEVCPSIGQLAKLTRLDLSVNNLLSLPSQIGDLMRLEYLNIKGNPLEKGSGVPVSPHTPYQILYSLMPALRDDRKVLRETKVLIVGQSSVGKTSLVKRLIGEDFDPKEPLTKGIRIRPWDVETERGRFHTRLWEFGGQEILQHTYQFFLTGRSLYVLVLDTRLDDEQNRLQHWLKMVQVFGRESPVIIVGNRSDECTFSINRRGLRAKYNSIRAFVETSCKNGDGITELKDAILREAITLPHVSEPIPHPWRVVKAHLEDNQAPYISYQDYTKQCENVGIFNESSQRELLALMHDLGGMFHYQDLQASHSQGASVLIPEWITGAVYRLIYSDEVKRNKGIMQWEWLEQILKSAEYPKETHETVLDAMRRYEFGFDLRGTSKRGFLISSCLQKEKPGDTGDWYGALVFQYRYNVLPDSFISRFIVRVGEYIDGDKFWRSGVLVRRGTCRALVEADRDERVISIRVNGEGRARQDLLAYVRTQLDQIHGDMEGIREYVLLPAHPEAAPISYQHLLNLERAGVPSYIPEGLVEPVSVGDLLDLIESREVRAEHEKLKLQSLPSAEAQTIHPQLGSRPQPSEPPAPETGKPRRAQSPWWSGLFYLVAMIALVGLLAFIGQWVPWYVFLIATVGAPLIVIVVAALQLRHDEKVGDETFLKLIVEALTRLATLKEIPGPRQGSQGKP